MYDAEVCVPFIRCGYTVYMCLHQMCESRINFIGIIFQASEDYFLDIFGLYGTIDGAKIFPFYNKCLPGFYRYVVLPA